MDFSEYSIKFKSKAEKAGYSESDISYYLDYAEKLYQKNLPVIYNTSHLGALTGYSTDYIRRAVVHTKYFYRTFYISKKNGKKRTINEPLPSLKEIQLWINDNVLSHIKPSKFAKAYIKSRGIIDNVKYHKAKKFIFNLDLQDFFPSISIHTIELFFLQLGYSNNLSNLLAKLCCLDGRLAQGAPTSPALSNHVLYQFDEAIGQYAVENNLRYTRYADDLTFSFNYNFDVAHIENKVKECLKLIEHSSLKINTEKTHLLKKSDRQVITGIVVNEFPQTPIKYRKRIRQEIYYIKKFGLIDHLNQIQETRKNYLYHILGKINFVLSINPKDPEMKSYKDFVQTLFTNSAND